jgi:pimeloyl-ACP methyl ester carboxylesterase
VLWSPEKITGPTALVLMGHGGGLHKKTPAMADRARTMVAAHGFHVAAIDAPGHGERPRTAEDDRARTEMRVPGRFKEVSVRYMASIARRAVPEWQATIDALTRLPELGAGAPVGFGGGISMGTAIGVPLTAADSRVRAAVFGGGLFVYDDLIAAARRVTVPVHFLLPWNDEHAGREEALALFDAFASGEKTLHANPGDHRTIRWSGLDENFLARHLN